MKAISRSAAQTGGAAGGAIDPAAFETYRAALRAFVARRVQEPQEIDDLVQEACARLLAAEQTRALDEPLAYLFRIAGNLIADRHRRARPVEPLIEAHHPTVGPAQEEARRAADLQRAFERALAELSPRCRQVFVLRRFDERRTGEIARELGMSPRMVQKHLSHAMAHLYDRLGHLMEIDR